MVRWLGPRALALFVFAGSRLSRSPFTWSARGLPVLPVRLRAIVVPLVGPRWARAGPDLRWVVRSLRFPEDRYVLSHFAAFDLPPPASESGSLALVWHPAGDSWPPAPWRSLLMIPRVFPRCRRVLRASGRPVWGWAARRRGLSLSRAVVGVSRTGPVTSGCNGVFACTTRNSGSAPAVAALHPVGYPSGRGVQSLAQPPGLLVYSRDIQWLKERGVPSLKEQWVEVHYGRVRNPQGSAAVNLIGTV